MKTYKQALFESISTDKDIKVRTKAAAAVIVRNDENGTKQILLIQRSASDHWPHFWEFPRGKCDRGENEETTNCVKREVKEETGLDINILGLIDKFQYIADGGTRLTTCYNYLCKLTNSNQKIKLSSEHQDFKWISQVGEAEMLVMPEQKKTIEKVLNPDSSIVSYPDNDFTQNNKIEEYLRSIQC